MSSTTVWRHKRWARLREALQETTAEAITTPSEDEVLSVAVGKLSIQQADEGPSTGTSRHDTSVQDTPGGSGASRRSGAQPASCPLPHPPPTIASQLDDLLHIQLSFIQCMIAFSSTGRPLRFIKVPAQDGEFLRWHIDSGKTCNSGKGALHPNDPQNAPFLEYQDGLSMTYLTLKSMKMPAESDKEIGEYHSGLVRQVLEELARLEDLKEWEWERQQTPEDPSQASAFSPAGSRFMINTGASTRFPVGPLAHESVSDRHIASQWTAWSPNAVPVYSYSIVSATSNLLLGLSRQATGLLMAGLRSTIQATLEYARWPGPLLTHDHRLLRQLVRDPRTVLNALDLDPHITTYNCCSRCFALYDLSGDVPDTCQNRAAPESAPCAAKLWRRRRIGDGQVSFPVRKYLHQSLKHWLGRMLSRGEIETWLQVNRWNGGRVRTPMRDIFDGIALQSLRGPDGKRAFLDTLGEELRLVLGLSADGFNPYQMKEAKHSVTSTAIYMVCLNLPESLRHLPENIYLVGVVPGPTKPSLDQINHFLSLVVDELLDFWTPGVYYTKTALRPQGRLVHAALVPLIADLVAARQLSGFGAHNHSRVLCSVCTTPADGVEDTQYTSFVPRDLNTHRAAAKAWLEARTTLEQEELFLNTGVRHSELLRLQYWNPLLYTVVDTMHNLYLGILQRHIRSIWGINVDEKDGDASDISSGAVPERPAELKMAAGTKLLLRASTKQLAKAGKAVLYHLCVDRGLRRAGTISQLVKNLEAWRKKEGFPVEQELATADNNDSLSVDVPVPEYVDGITPGIEKAERTLRGKHASTALRRKHKDILQAMCLARKLDTSGAKDVLADRLLAWPPKSSRSSQHAIGQDTLSAYMEDRSRMILPSWMNAPPLAFGTKQHGKLSADQWRTLCTVNLPVTLIRTWSFQEERRVKMLENFLHIVEAVETFGLLEIDERQIEAAEHLMQKYLDGLKELYKGAKIQPNHHLALHIGVFLRLFGPVHSWRSFVFERFNYFLQSINTNMAFGMSSPAYSVFSIVRATTKIRIGELEMTFMMHSCRAANFRPLLRSPPVQRYMQDFANSLRAADKDDRRGMRLDAILRSVAEDEAPQPNGMPFKGSRPTSLEHHVYRALLERLSFESGNSYVDDREYFREHPAGKSPLSRSAVQCSVVSVSGVQYKPWRRSPGDSNVMFRHPVMGSGSHPGHIDQIFLLSGRSGEDSIGTFLVVKALQPLTPEDAVLDPYRKYPTVGGRLYYKSYSDTTLVLRTDDVVSHFAETLMDHLVVSVPTLDTAGKQTGKMSKTCVHVRPLDRVSGCFTSFCGGGLMNVLS
ncbi:hypothetical protein TRAPUB_12619 [Trametes pubescens]|uniref:SAP domain-containing protein n=1 Tax=Trametes pubescens TaxID=154538 RepID=A0A1M2VTC8_TRAPU|nr:hypothetical protein TRAPUB_12619 [Trametes pubescens]